METVQKAPTANSCFALCAKDMYLHNAGCGRWFAGSLLRHPTFAQTVLAMFNRCTMTKKRHALATWRHGQMS